MSSSAGKVVRNAWNPQAISMPVVRDSGWSMPDAAEAFVRRRDAAPERPLVFAELTSRVVYGHLTAGDFKLRVSAEPVDRLVSVRRP